MPDTRLQELVRRRLWELRMTAEEASRRSRWVLPPEAISRLARPGGKSWISEGLAKHLAHALDVPESRVRLAADLPAAPDPREDISTRPHLRLVGKDG